MPDAPPAGPWPARLRRRLRPLLAWLPASLLGRIALAFGLVATASIGLGTVLVHDALTGVVSQEHERALVASAAPIRQKLVEGGVPALRSAELPPDVRRRFDAGTGSMRFAVLDAEGRVLEASGGAHPALPQRDAAGDPARQFRVPSAGSVIWGISQEVATPQGPVTLQVAEDMALNYVVLDDVPASAILPVVLVLATSAVLLLAVSVAAVLLLLGPLRRAAQEAAAVRPGTSARLSEDGVPAEARPLIRAVNSALDRLEEALAQQRAFSLDVAHELRTPLAILLTEVELLEETRATARIREDLLGLAQLVNRLLEAAEALESRPDARAAFDLAELSVRLAARLAQVGEREGRSLAVLGAEEPLLVRGDADAVGRALRNLMENALRHSARGTTVELRLRRPGTVEVADRGPGLPKGDRSRLFERLWRADRGAGGGTGLGLAIAQRIAQAQGGRIEAQDNPGGGAVFVLSLEPAPADAAAPRIATAAA